MADAREVALGLLDSLAEYRERYLPRLELHRGAPLCSVLGDDHPQAWAFVADLEDALRELGVAVPEGISNCNPLARGPAGDPVRAEEMVGAAGEIARLRAKVAAMGEA